MMDRLSIAGRRGGRPRRLPEVRGAAAGRAGRARGRGGRARWSASRRSAATAAPGRSALAQSEAERAAVWKGRKAAFAAMGRISPNYIVQDGVIPRTALPEVLREIARAEREAGLRVANVFHAGDGNLHPLVLYDRRDRGPGAPRRAAGGGDPEACVEAGGSITGEHGVGARKAGLHVRDVRRAGPGDDAAGALRVRPAAAVQPGQDFPAPRAVRRKARPLRRTRWNRPASRSCFKLFERWRSEDASDSDMVSYLVNRSPCHAVRALHRAIRAKKQSSIAAGS